MNLVLQLVLESQIKSKTDELDLAREKRNVLSVTFVLPSGNSFNTFIFFLNI